MNNTENEQHIRLQEERFKAAVSAEKLALHNFHLVVAQSKEPKPVEGNQPSMLGTLLQAKVAHMDSVREVIRTLAGYEASQKELGPTLERQVLTSLYLPRRSVAVRRIFVVNPVTLAHGDVLFLETALNLSVSVPPLKYDGSVADFNAWAMEHGLQVREGVAIAHF
jgi:hypothetical protein